MRPSLWRPLHSLSSTLWGHMGKGKLALPQVPLSAHSLRALFCGLWKLYCSLRPDMFSFASDRPPNFLKLSCLIFQPSVLWCWELNLGPPA